MNAQVNPRYHALDSMRATMMLLGIYLHVVVGYSGNGHWPYIDAHPTHALDFTLGLIHSFRMPAFYLMAGFFGALLWDRRGQAGFAANRAKRVLLPFALFWTLMFPVIAAIVISLEQGPDKILPVFASGEVLRRLHPLHLWFLEYLVFLYVIVGFGVHLAKRLPESVQRALMAAYRWGLQRWYAPILFALFSWLPLTAMRGTLKDCDGFKPEFLILAAYLVPFVGGWLLYYHRDLLPRFRQHIWLYLALSLPAFAVYGLVPGGEHPWIKSAGNAILCWLLTFACLGLFLRYFDNPSPRWRYMSDASYWMFIIHMPVVVGLQVAFRPVPLPALAKIPLVLALSVAILVISYDFLVRPTWVGELLNGRRYPRRSRELPAAGVSPAEA